MDDDACRAEVDFSREIVDAWAFERDIFCQAGEQ
jgi:hypothetical protein